jgi:transposase InsO family protein
VGQGEGDRSAGEHDEGEGGVGGVEPVAETVNGLYKTELIHRRGPWRTIDDVELATLGWVHWFNTTRLHGALGDIPPAGYEAAHYAQPALAG